jgi:chromosome segregation ATPase
MEDRNQAHGRPLLSDITEREKAMADQKTTEEMNEAMEKQVAELKRQIEKINEKLSEQAAQAAETAKGWYDSASSKASNAASALRTQAQTVSEVAQENPVTISTAALAIGFVGFMIGFAVGQSSSGSHRYWR